MARCVVCGFVTLDGDGKPSEAQLPREVAESLTCQGCQAEYEALIAEGLDAGQAKAQATQGHYRRCDAALKARSRLWLERNAAGKSAVDGVTALQDFTDEKGRTYTVADFMARAQAMLDAMDAREGA